MSDRDNKVLIENKTVINYWLYLEYAKQVLRAAGPRALSGCASLWFIIISVAITLFFVYIGGIPIMIDRAGLLFTIAAFFILPAAFLFGVVFFYTSISPYIMLSSRFRTKHAKKFFTDKNGVQHKEVKIRTTFCETDITVERFGEKEDIPWHEVMNISESKHFYFLILAGEIADPWPFFQAFIKSGIILAKNGFTIGSWEDLKGYLAKYGNAELQDSMLKGKR